MKSIGTLAVVAAFGLLSAYAEEPPLAPDCNPSSYSKQVAGAKTYVCVTINGRKRALFTPTLDDFTLITLDGSENACNLNA